MGRILRIYVIREVAIPTLLALLTITFIMLIGMMNQVIFKLITLMFQPGVRAIQVFRILLTFIPQMLVLAMPMALLVGSLIGVGRLVLDREILAVRASGINLFNIFYPLIIGALFISFAIMWVAGNVNPRLMLTGLSGINELQFAVASSLEPGRFHDKLFAGDNDFTIYFRERDPKTSDMKGVVLKWEAEVKPKKPAIGAPGSSPLTLTPGAAAASTTSATQALASIAATTNEMIKDNDTEKYKNKEKTKNKDKDKAKDKDKDKSGKDSPPAPDDLYRDTELTVVCAESGVIDSKVKKLGTGDVQHGSIVLSLRNGSIHRLNPDPASKDYTVIRFKKLERKMFNENIGESVRPHRAMTNTELSKIIDRRPTDRKSKQGKDWLRARSEYIQRFATSLACFAFALIGIPLAIWLRPTGKSWGILLAIMLMLVYYILMRTGLSMVEADQPLGVFVAFLPTILFVALGGGLWWHTVRS